MNKRFVMLTDYSYVLATGCVGILSDADVIYLEQTMIYPNVTEWELYLGI